MRVAVDRVARERLTRWAADCTRDHATPLVLVAVGHDERSGELHIYRTEDGPSDAEIGALLRRVGEELGG